MSLNELSSRDIVGRIFQRLESAVGEVWPAKIAILLPTNQETENHKWVGFSTAVRQWVGERQAKGLKVNGVSLTNVLYENSMNLSVEDVRRDKTGQIQIRIDELVDGMIGDWAPLLTTLIQNGESTACYDGQFYFDTDHQEGDSPTQSNDLAVGDYSELNVTTPTNPTAYELANVIIKMIQHQHTYKNDQNQPMNRYARKFLVMVPISFLGAAVQAVMNPTLDTGSGVINNPLAGFKQGGYTIEVAPNPDLTWTTKLALFRTDGSAKGLIRQAEVHSSGSMPQEGEAMGVEVQSLAEGSDHEVKTNHWLFGTKSSRSVGYGYWQYATLATLS